jgi:hypothetical protein
MPAKSVRVAGSALAAAFVALAVMPLAAQGASEPPKYFDLGINVTLLPQDPVAAKKYFQGQDATTQSALLAACENYIKHPVDAEMPETLVFCAAIMQ